MPIGWQHMEKKLSNPSGLFPIEFNVVVEPDAVETKTAGGIILIAKERDELAVDEGVIVAVSPHAFTYADWLDDADKPQVGQRVIFSRYAGALHERRGRKFRVVKDKDIVAVIEGDAALAATA